MAAGPGVGTLDTMTWDELDEATRAALEAVGEVPPGPGQVAAAESALSQAQLTGSFAAEFTARQILTDALHHVPDDPRDLVHFVWLRQALDSGHALGPEDRAAAAWKLKWALSLMLRQPQLPLLQVEEAVDDLEQLFRRHGWALRPILQQRAAIAAARGDLAAAQQFLSRWEHEPRDELSDCRACDIRERAVLLGRADPERALAVLAPVLTETVGCSGEPALSLGHAVLLHTGHGIPGPTVDYLQRAWALAKDTPELASTVSRALIGWVRVGDPARALSGLLPRLPWLEALPDPGDRFMFTAAGALVLTAAEGAGLTPATLEGRPTQAVRDDLRGEAAGIAAAFDRRNGSTVHSDLLAGLLDQGLLATGPALTPTMPSPPGPGTPPGRAPGPRSIRELAAEARNRLAAVSSTVQDTVGEWVACRARLLERAGPDDDRDIAFLELTAASDADPDLAAQMLDRAAAAAARAGDTGHLLRVQAQRLTLAARKRPDPETVERAAARVVQIAQDLEAREQWRDAGAVWRSWARVLGPDEAAPLLLRAAAASARAGEPWPQALALLDAAQACLSRQDPGTAGRCLRQAEPLVTGHRELAAYAVHLRARLLADGDRVDEAVAVLATALGGCDLPAAARIPLRFLLCELRLQAGDWDRLIADGDLLVREVTRAGDPSHLAVAQRLLGVGYVETGRFVEAAKTLEAAFPVIRREHPWLLAGLGWALGGALEGVGDFAGARTAFATAATSFEAEGRLEDAGQAQARAGGAAWDADDPAAAQAHLEAALERAETVGEVGLFTWSARSLAAVRFEGGSTDDLSELFAVVDRATRFAAACQEPFPDAEATALRCSLQRQGAHLVGARERWDEAIRLLAHAEADTGDPDEVAALQAERGLFLVQAGRFEEAGPLLRVALAQMTGDDWRNGRHQAVRRWAGLLDRAGRTVQADKVWQEFGTGD